MSQEHKILAKRARKIQSEPAEENIGKNWLVTLLDDDHDFIDEVQKLSHELTVVALYKKMEITTKRAVLAAYPDTPPASLSRIKALKKALKAKGVPIEELPHYKAMDETRCLNNDIKHNGVVGKELAAYTGWKKGKPLQSLDSAYRRLAPLCAIYMGELVGALIQKRRASISVNRALQPTSRAPLKAESQRTSRAARG